MGHGSAFEACSGWVGRLVCEWSPRGSCSERVRLSSRHTRSFPRDVDAQLPEFIQFLGRVGMQGRTGTTLTFSPRSPPAAAAESLVAPKPVLPKAKMPTADADVSSWLGRRALDLNRGGPFRALTPVVGTGTFPAVREGWALCGVWPAGKSVECRCGPATVGGLNPCRGALPHPLAVGWEGDKACGLIFEFAGSRARKPARTNANTSG